MRPQNHTNRWLQSLCLAFVLAPQAGAVTTPPRVAASQTPDGATVEILLDNGEKVKGKLYGVSSEGVTVVTRQGTLAVQPVEVKFDQMKSFKHRQSAFKNFLAGVGVVVTFLFMASAIALGM